MRSAIAATSGSSALSTAVPSAGSASTISPFACAIASREPNSPMWAVPTLSTAATCGGAIRAQLGDVADAAGAHLEGEEAGSGVARSTVSGTPISLLRLPSVQTVSPAPASTWARKSLVPVFPCDPVSASTVRQGVEHVPRRAAQGHHRVVDDHGRDAGRREPRAPPAAPAVDRGGREVVPVDVLAGHGHEESTRLGARVSMNGGAVTSDGPVTGVSQPSAEGPGDLSRLSGIIGAAPPRATSRSSNGCISPATSWPDS